MYGGYYTILGMLIGWYDVVYMYVYLYGGYYTILGMLIGWYDVVYMYV